ncbi:MAG TPA: hypothetical protein VN598_07120 [Usitatibacter sp.]|nr:hypothetical protein [Usitatibacter sp.]
MGKLWAVAIAAALAAWMGPARAAEEAFDACDVFTQGDAEKALGTTAATDPVNPKVKRPKVILSCTYKGFKEGKPVSATVQFRFSRTDAEAEHAFEDARLQFQTKPMLISGAQAFWSGKTGQLNLRKGRTWVTVVVGSDRPSERDSGEARKAAEALAKKL